MRRGPPADARAERGQGSRSRSLLFTPIMELCSSIRVYKAPRTPLDGRLLPTAPCWAQGVGASGLLGCTPGAGLTVRGSGPGIRPVGIIMVGLAGKGMRVTGSNCYTHDLRDEEAGASPPQALGTSPGHVDQEVGGDHGIRAEL